MNYKIRNYYIKSIDQPNNNDSTFNYNRLRNNPRNYTFKTFKKDDIIINDIVNNINKNKGYINETIYIIKYPENKTFIYGDDTVDIIFKDNNITSIKIPVRQNHGDFLNFEFEKLLEENE